MPTPTEIIHPELTYCDKVDDHCLCPKCTNEIEKTCLHQCMICKGWRNTKEETKKEIKDNAEDHAKITYAWLEKPVLDCPYTADKLELTVKE